MDIYLCCCLCCFHVVQKEERLSEHVCASIMASVLKMLAHCHDHHICYGDVKVRGKVRNMTAC